MSNEKNKAEGVEEAAERIINSYHPSSRNIATKADLWHKEVIVSALVEMAHWQRNDPAFIAEIVGKTLAYVANGVKEHEESGVVLRPVQFLLMHPYIVNQILNEKI